MSQTFDSIGFFADSRDMDTIGGTNDMGFEIVLECNFMDADDDLFKLVDIKQLYLNVNGIIMHLLHALVIETRLLSGIVCDRCSTLCNVSTRVGLETNQYDLGEYSVQLAHESRNSPLKMEGILSSTSLLCSRESLKRRSIILGEIFHAPSGCIAETFISDFYFIPIVLPSQCYLIHFRLSHVSTNVTSFFAHATMLTSLSSWKQDFRNFLFSSKATASPTAALRGGNEFSVALSSNSDNCADNCINNCVDLSIISVSTECQPSRWLSRGIQGFGNVMKYIADNGNINELPHRKVKRKRMFSNGFSNAVDDSSFFAEGDEPMRCNRLCSPKKSKTIDFTGAIEI